MRIDQANQLRDDKAARKVIKGSRWLLLRNAYNQAAYTTAWWWVVAPGALLWFLIMNLFIIARLIEDEERTNIRSQQ
jgi:hypothetical protein